MEHHGRVSPVASLRECCACDIKATDDLRWTRVFFALWNDTSLGYKTYEHFANTDRPPARNKCRPGGVRKEGTMAVRPRYKLKLVRGALYVDRLHVQAVIDHDLGEIRVSDEVDVATRLELAAKAMRLASRHRGGVGILSRVYGAGGAGARGHCEPRRSRHRT